MNKNRIRLTESELHNIIKESVKRVKYAMDHYDPDHNLTDDEKKYQMDADWRKIDDAYEDHILASDWVDLENDELNPYFDGGIGAMHALGAYGDDWANYAKSFHGTALKDTPMRNTDDHLTDYGKKVYKGVPDNIDESIRRAIRKVLR